MFEGIQNYSQLFGVIQASKSEVSVKTSLIVNL